MLINNEAFHVSNMLQVAKEQNLKSYEELEAENKFLQKKIDSLESDLDYYIDLAMICNSA